MEECWKRNGVVTLTLSRWAECVESAWPAEENKDCEIEAKLGPVSAHVWFSADYDDAPLPKIDSDQIQSLLKCFGASRWSLSETQTGGRWRPGWILVVDRPADV